MSKRYGRNQRRAHREEIEELKQIVESERAMVNHAVSRLASAEYRASNAVAEAAKIVTENQDVIRFALAEISRELAKALPGQLYDAAKQILDARRDAPPIRLSIGSEPCFEQFKTIRVRGEIPALRYEINIPMGGF